MTFGSLFAGIGGFDLGLERAGMKCKWQVEIDDYANKILEKHWPEVPRHRDVREVGSHNLEPVDLICGGFPCQDISIAGKGHERRGIDGERSGLWGEYARIIRHLRPRYVLIENSPELAVLGLGRVLTDLAKIGMDAEWGIIRASQVGAKHRRARMFICAYATSERRKGRQRVLDEESYQSVSALGFTSNWPHLSSPLGCRGSDGIPNRMDRLRCLGNAVVPQVAEWIGRRIMEANREVCG